MGTMRSESGISGLYKSKLENRMSTTSPRAVFLKIVEMF